MKRPASAPSRSVSRALAGALLTTVALSATACGGGPADQLIVFHTASDYGYFDDCGCRSDSTGGLAKRAWVIDSLRNLESSPFLVVSAGDFSGGENAYGAALGRVLIDAMTLMEYDAFTFGEWDLNHGAEYLRSIVERTPVAWVHTNYEIEGLDGLGHKRLIVEKGGRLIGLLGILNPAIGLSGTIEGRVDVEPDVVASTARAVAALRAEGVDLVVVLSHLSYPGNLTLAAAVDGIDLIVSGHLGKLLAGAEEAEPGTWVVASGDIGRYLGRARIDFASTVEGGVEAVAGDLILMEPALPDDPRLTPLFDRYADERAALMERELNARRPSRSEEPVQAPPERPTGRLENPVN